MVSFLPEYNYKKSRHLPRAYDPSLYCGIIHIVAEEFSAGESLPQGGYKELKEEEMEALNDYLS
ncbi:MAG: hypothetical protein PHG58_09475 [Clostridia bacterium]|nr:hypothetical protein [Clostridia bacterium]